MKEIRASDQNQLFGLTGTLGPGEEDTIPYCHRACCLLLAGDNSRAIPGGLIAMWDGRELRSESFLTQATVSHSSCQCFGAATNLGPSPVMFWASVFKCGNAPQCPP